MYKVVTDFTDLQDSEKLYIKGDTYPREGIEPIKARIIELLSSNNARGEPLIEKIKESKPKVKKKK